MLRHLTRIHKQTGEVGAPQGGAQLLQNQGPPQPGACIPVLPTGEEGSQERLVGQGGAVLPSTLSAVNLTLCGPPSAGLGDAQ